MANRRATSEQTIRSQFYKKNGQRQLWPFFALWRGMTMKTKFILLTICTVLLLMGCGQTAVPEADAQPAAAHEETIPAAGAQTVLIETA